MIPIPIDFRYAPTVFFHLVDDIIKTFLVDKFVVGTMVAKHREIVEPLVFAYHFIAFPFLLSDNRRIACNDMREGVFYTVGFAGCFGNALRPIPSLPPWYRRHIFRI